ncbi:MAG TPA: type II toxin-antitoxin system ParD family antitoxin [Rhodothermales bacterium]|nr:type II toxin-antitoxin system ParD family antitoxin [Rhodothermales bacterium]
MNVSITSSLEALVKRLVKSGRYGSASEVVRDGLRLIQEREQFREVKLEELRRLVREGRESGPATSWDVEDFKREAKARRERRASK